MSRCGVRRWNWSPRSGPPGGSASREVAAWFLLVLVAGLSAAQQSGSPTTVATLSSGPDSRRGIELFAPDLTPFWYGRYSVGSGTVEVRYTEDPLPETTDWLPAPCSQRTVVTDGGQHYRYSADDGSWYILLTTDGPVDICGFVDVFVDRFLFFERIESRARGNDPPSFPAILEIPVAQLP